MKLRSKSLVSTTFAALTALAVSAFAGSALADLLPRVTPAAGGCSVSTIPAQGALAVFMAVTGVAILAVSRRKQR